MSFWVENKVRWDFRSERRRQQVAHVRYIKIQLKTLDITTRLYGVNHTNLYIILPKPRRDVYCFNLNFNISNVGYSKVPFPEFFLPQKCSTKRSKKP